MMGGVCQVLSRALNRVLIGVVQGQGAHPGMVGVLQAQPLLQGPLGPGGGRG